MSGAFATRGAGRAALGLALTIAVLGAGCDPAVETTVTNLRIDLRPCIGGEPLQGGDAGVSGGSTCGATLDRAVASGLVNACLVVQPLDRAGPVRRLPLHWEDGALSQPVDGDLALEGGLRFESALFFLAESDSTGAICEAYAPSTACADDARCVLKLTQTEATMGFEGPTTLDFTGPDGMCNAENGPPFADGDGPVERCDGLDNDCDRRVDEGFALGLRCEVGVGACFAVGETVCDETGDGTTCGAQPNALSSERCGDGEGIDDDCDGRVDEGLPCFPCALDGDCADHPEGAECVGGRCRACDPLDPGFAGCGPDALCCRSGDEIACVDGTLEVCTACTNGGCSPISADGCAGRACACGDGPECAGDAPFCVGGVCVRCRTALGHQDCGPDELCCNGACVRTGPGPDDVCTGCGEPACDPLNSNRCDDRSCLCGTELPCSAPLPVCDPAAPGDCVECIGNAQCRGLTGREVCDVGRRTCVRCLVDAQCEAARPECVGSTCVECDADDAGEGYRCAEDGDAPICAGGACRACEGHDECADRPGDFDFCVNGRCRPCDPDGDAGCVDPAAPICDPATATCRSCADAGECNENLAPALAVLQCAPDGRCVGCVPDAGDDGPNIGCQPDSSTPICDAAGEVCRPCADDAECPAQAPFADGVPFEALTQCVSGRCRECAPAGDDRAQAGCQPDGPTPICVRGDCVPCETDGQCAAVDGAEPICVRGRCRACDPADERGCGDVNFPICDPVDFACRGCDDAEECNAGNPPGAPIELCVDGRCAGCDPESNAGCDNTTAVPVCADDDGDLLAECRGCFDDAECAAVAALGGPEPDRLECVDGRCFACDPGDHGGCDPFGPAPFCARDADGAFRCRGCDRDAECALVADGRPACVGGTCRACDPGQDGVLDDEGCAAPTAVCDPGTFTCRGCADDAECPDGLCRLDTGTCAACVPETQRGCDLDGGAPFCDPARATCRPCAVDAECADNPNGALCVAGACVDCDPADHRGCGDDFLCCAAGGADPTCVETSVDACEACGVACEGANRCADRTCLCGDDAACDSPTPYCEGAAPGGVCVGCFTDDDCPPSHGECVEGICVACDPRLGEGAAGCAPDLGRPYCDPDISACVGCDGDDALCAEHAGRPECVADSCFECDPDDATVPEGQVGCDLLGERPYCDPAENACVGCAEQDDRCLTAARGQCVGDACFECDPRVLQGYAGCVPDSPAPFCDPETSTCQSCGGDDAQCDESPIGGQCVGDFCRVCDPADHEGCVGLDTLCCEDGAGVPECRATDFAVECEACGVPCDPVTADNCTERACRCGDAPACADGTPFCLGSECVECVADADCGDGTICVNNACVQCDPADDRGCIADSDAPVCGDDFTCRGCQDNAECDANANGPICLGSGECRVCDPEEGDSLHEGCEASELCCDADGPPSCQPTGPGAGDQCESCGAACDPVTADTCFERDCRCGDEAACAGDTPYCVDGACEECRGDDDCEGDALCVDNVCRACDPTDNDGCFADSDTPVCDAATFTCRGCDRDAAENECADNANGRVCLGSGECRVCDPEPGPEQHAGCESDALCCDAAGLPECQPTAPEGQCESCGAACDPTTADTCFERGCRCGAEAACAGDTPYCVDGACEECRGDDDCDGGAVCVDNVCRACDPADDDGCIADSEAPVCDAVTFTCRACDAEAAENECADNPTGAICTGAGTCRVCDVGDHDGCGADELCCEAAGAPACQPTGPGAGEQCESCGAVCDPVTADTCFERDCRCGAAAACAGDTPYCVDGACEECRGDDDCDGDALCVDNVCRACDPTDDDGCIADSDTPVCDAVTFTCRACDADAAENECDTNPNGATCTDAGSCKACDVADHDGCGLDELCCGERAAPGCEPADPDTQCEACGEPCDADTADTCTERGCACGAGPVCEGATPYCVGSTCVACRADADCGGDTLCVAGACVQCDPVDDRGCLADSDAPVCGDDFTCRGCQGDAECDGNENGTTCLPLTGTCRACNPLNHDGCAPAELCCDAGEGIPGCQPTDPAAQCEGCGVACDPLAADGCAERGCVCGADPACAGETPYCVNGACAECLADADCAAAEQVCVDNACVDCRDDADCGGDTPLCDPTGACVACLGDADCGGDLCVAGACVECDPADHRGCGANELCCDANGTPTCEPTGVASQCEACDVRCRGSNKCSERVCLCGERAPCPPGQSCFGGVCVPIGG